MVVQARIAKYLHDKGLIKCRVAKEAGISATRFSKIINGQTELKADEYEKICIALEVSPSKFLSDPSFKNE